MTLTEFLLARIAEDEYEIELLDLSEYRPDYIGLHITDDGPAIRMSHARAKAECEAKRVAVDWYLNDDDTVMRPTIKALAAVYADHPDYDPAWRTAG